LSSEADPKDDAPWVELRRFNDPLEADMARDFLEQSGVPVLVRGNSGVTGVLNRFDTILDIRLNVPEAELEHAREALEAMQSPVRNEAPFRGFGHEKEARREDADESDDAPIARKKSPFLASGFALMLPIGAGHMYAGHAAAGQMFAMAIVPMAVLAFSGWIWLWVPVGILIVADMMLAPFAAQRFNSDRVPSASRQRGWSLAAIFGALVVAYVVSR